jgi:hypothetical protein
MTEGKEVEVCVVVGFQVVVEVRWEPVVVTRTRVLLSVEMLEETLEEKLADLVVLTLVTFLVVKVEGTHLDVLEEILMDSLPVVAWLAAIMKASGSTIRRTRIKFLMKDKRDKER